MAPSSTPAEASRAPLGRVLTAMVTPFTAGGDLDLPAAQRLATHLVDTGNDGLVVSGTTGESPTTSDAEKDALLRAVVEAVGDRATVVAGTGTNDTRHAVELSVQAEKAGAHGLLVVTPYYNKPPQEGLLAHFRTIADSTGLPVMLYDIPGRTGTAIATETLIRLGEHQRIVAVKDAKGDIAGTTAVLARSDLAYYSGSDEWNLALLATGAVGVVSVVAHVAAREYADMLAAVDAGDLATARAIDRRLVPAFQAIMTRTQGAIMAKAALEVLGVLPGRTVRPPLVPATEDQLRALGTDLREAGLTS
ncbi:4-hydroxy-tetrahydrodipicolinate synthase [Actinopolymorpha singaporensis]|uniref:4-hydroxy-tetrahydrodipicolinate synthase n=1 Tax=Actinopolymorpha singaporensis TaxID=117157 RepID=A0A1H1XWB4_9ACTN|nr:4-hydroxy-tetrahydrodipicolinate synthase [Actinopolymorpha singaporensis]SDT13321.1 dihydrodipicolinate synthase [Actinopolymorpha singaporensis]